MSSKSTKPNWGVPDIPSPAVKKPSVTDCCAKPTAPKSCCESISKPSDADSCCDSSSRKFDWLLWGSLAACAAAISLHLTGWDQVNAELAQFSHSVTMLLGEMWWGLALGIVAVGVLGHIPREFIMSALGRHPGINGLFRATGAGLLLDLCNHGILLVGMTLYKRGATLGQTMAFLIASPWNSLSLTLILAALIGWWWTLIFIAASGVIALLTGWLFDKLVAAGKLPTNPNRSDLPKNFQFWREAKSSFANISWSPRLVLDLAWEGIKGSRMILRWLLFGTLMAAAIRVFVPADVFGEFFGPSVIGLLLTLVAATVIEVCSEGSTPIAADLFNRAGAPGNAFTFLMAGAATDYTEIMALKETTRSWKISLFLPLLTVPQVLILAWIMNLSPAS